MAKMDWDRVNVENLDYHHKKEIEREEGERASHGNNPTKTGASSSVIRPHCKWEVGASKYRFHFAELHFFKTGSVSTVTLLAMIGENGLLVSGIPTCVFDDVWEFLRSRFDFNQHYSSEKIRNKLPTEIRRYLFEVHFIDLSERGQSDILQRAAEIIRDVAEKLNWIAWANQGRLSLHLKLAGFGESFSSVLLDLLRTKKGQPKGNGKRTKLVREIAKNRTQARIRGNR